MGTYTVELDVLAPADTLVNGLDASSSPGLVAEGDTAVPAIKDVVELALLFCYAHLASSEDGARSEHYARLISTQMVAAQSAYGYDKSADIAKSFTSLTGVKAAQQQALQQAIAAAAQQSSAA
jgi:hypothetical protein